MDQLADLGDLNNPLGEGFELFGDEELPPIEDLNLAFDLDGVSLQPEEEHQAPPILLTNEDLFGTSVAAPSHGDISALDLELEL